MFLYNWFFIFFLFPIFSLDRLYKLGEVLQHVFCGLLGVEAVNDSNIAESYVVLQKFQSISFVKKKVLIYINF